MGDVIPGYERLTWRSKEEEEGGQRLSEWIQGNGLSGTGPRAVSTLICPITGLIRT